jgi:hypothetical protein
VALAPKAAEPRKSALLWFYGAACFVFTIASLLLLGSASQSGRYVGLILVLAAGMMAWLGERARYRSLYPQSSRESRAHYIFFAFAVAGALAFLMPPEDRVRVVRYVLLLLARALARR